MNTQDQGQNAQQKTVKLDEVTFKVSAQGAQAIVGALSDNYPMSKVEDLVNDLRKQFKEQAEAAAIEQGVIPDPKAEGADKTVPLGPGAGPVPQG